MSGICGVFGGDTLLMRRAIHVMQEAQAFCGTDTMQTYQDERFALGYRGLLTTPQAWREIQPYQADGLYVVADVRLDWREELVANLQHSGLVAALEEPDVALLLKAYQAWGTEFVRRIDGDYAFAIWDERHERLVCGRDRLGLRPFFYRWEREQFLFASTLEALVATCHQTPAWEPDYFISFIVQEGTVDETVTPYQGLHRLPAGHLLIAEGGKSRTQRYWELQSLPEVRMNDLSDYAARFRELFTQSVRDRMRATGPVGVSMSGGLDSTSIFCVGCHAHPGITRKQFFPVTLVFDRSPESDERNLIQYVTDQYGIETYPVVADDLWSYKGFPYDAPHSAEPFVNASTHGAQSSIYQRAKELGAKVVLTGASGDAVLSGSNRVVADYVWTFQWGKAARHISQLAQLRSEPFLKNFKQYGIDPLFEQPTASVWLAPQVREKIEAARPVRGRIARERQEKQILQLLTRYIDQHLAAPLGVEARHPFLDRRLVEFLISIPMEQKLMGSVKKRILRRAMQGILPDPIRNRLDKTMHYSLIYRGLQEEWPAMMKAFTQGHLAEMGLVDQDAFLQAILLWKQGDARQADRLWTVASLELWLYRQGLHQQQLVH